MSEIGEVFNALRGYRQVEAKQRRDRAADDYREASALASEAGLMLRKYDEATYAIESRAKRWRINVYPGNQRLYMDRNRPRAPYLQVEDWTLKAVVMAAIEAEKGATK